VLLRGALNRRGIKVGAAEPARRGRPPKAQDERDDNDG